MDRCNTMFIVCSFVVNVQTFRCHFKEQLSNRDPSARILSIDIECQNHWNIPLEDRQLTTVVYTKKCIGRPNKMIFIYSL